MMNSRIVCMRANYFIYFNRMGFREGWSAGSVDKSGGRPQFLAFSVAMGTTFSGEI